MCKSGKVPKISRDKKMNEIELINQIMNLGLDKDPRVMALLQCLIRNPRDKDKSRMLNRLIGPHLIYNQMFGKPFKQASDHYERRVQG